MTDAKEALIKEPYPFVNARKLEQFLGSTVALVGKIEKIESSSLIVKTTDGKLLLIDFDRQRGCGGRLSRKR